MDNIPSPEQTQQTPQPSSQPSATPQASVPSQPSAQPSQPSYQQTSQPQGQPSSQPSQQAQTSWTGIRDYARGNYGVDLSHYPDEATALQALVNAYQQLPQVQQQIPYLQNLARYGSEYLMSEEQKRRQPAQPEQKQEEWGFKAPMSREEMRQLAGEWLVTGPDGKPMFKPETPPSVRQQLSEADRFYARWDEGLRYDPESTLEPLIEKKFGKFFEQRWGKLQAQQAAAQAHDREAHWIYQKDQNGNPIRGQWTPEGQLWAQYVVQLDQAGIKDANALATMARERVEADMYRRQLQQWQAWYQAQQAQGRPQAQVPPAANLPPHTPQANPPQTEPAPQGAGGLRAMLSQSLAPFRDQMELIGQ